MLVQVYRGITKGQSYPTCPKVTCCILRWGGRMSSKRMLVPVHQCWEVGSDWSSVCVAEEMAGQARTVLWFFFNLEMLKASFGAPSDVAFEIRL